MNGSLQRWLLGLCASFLVLGVTASVALAFGISNRLTRVETKIEGLQEDISIQMSDRWTGTDHANYDKVIEHRLKGLEKRSR